MRHNQTIYIFQKLLNFAGVQHSIREPQCISSGTRKRADILISHNQERRGYDLAVISPNFPSYCTKAALEAFHAADSKFKEKLSKHFVTFALENSDFVPLIIESTGAIHPRMIREIQSLVTLSDQRQPPHHSFNIRNSLQFWTHYISIAAVKGTMAKQIEARKIAWNKVATLLKFYQPLSTHAQPVLMTVTPSYQIRHNIAQHSSAQATTCLVLGATCRGQTESIDSPAKT